MTKEELNELIEKWEKNRKKMGEIIKQQTTIEEKMSRVNTPDELNKLHLEYQRLNIEFEKVIDIEKELNWQLKEDTN